ncbi:MAG: hypothetical protein IIX17_00500 [Tidjanibacter sp.]|nr:hypothetical protein [Tidjanibacter sp.]
MNFYAISLPILLLLHLLEGVAVVWLYLLRRRGSGYNTRLREVMSRLYRYAIEGVLPAPPRSPRRRRLMAEALFSLTRHLSLLSVEERERLGRRCSLTVHLLNVAERRGGVAQAEALQPLSVIPLDGGYVRRVENLHPAEPMGQLYRLVALACHSPERVAELLDAARQLPSYLVPRLVARLEECRVALPVRSLMASGGYLSQLVALRVIARYELSDHTEEVYGVLTSPYGEVRLAAIKALAAIGATVDCRVVEATDAMTIAERRDVLRLFLREGYSAYALKPLSDAEARVGSPLADYAVCRTSSRKRTLVKT